MYCYQKVYHIIRPGDTIFWLAQMYDTTVEEIMDNNPGINPQNLQIGSRIIVCPGKAGMGQVGMPQMPPQGMPPQGMPMQGMPMQGMPMQNMPMQNMPMQNMPGQGLSYDQGGYYSPTGYYPAMGYMPPETDSYGPPESNQLHDDMRRAWAQHVYWTRMLLISIAEHLTDQGAVTTKVMENPQEIADIFAPYFSQEAANEITNLLTEHLQIGTELITALRDNQMDKANELNKQWHVNAEKIAEALAAMNPNYDKRQLQNMLEQHLDMTAQEVSARLARDYPEDIKAFDQVEQGAEEMADYLSSGIVQ